MANAKKAVTASKSQGANAEAVAGQSVMDAQMYAERASALAQSAADCEVETTRRWAPLYAEFEALTVAAGVPRGADGKFDWESEKGKSHIAFIRSKVLSALAGNSYYDIEVHRTSDGADDYRRVDGDHAANFTITGKLALAADLKSLPSVADSQFGLKAWLRGQSNGERPDGGTPLRDLIKNTADQIISRMKRSTVAKAKGKRGDAADLADFLRDLAKFLEPRRAKYARDNGDDSVLGEKDFAAACEEFFDTVILE